MLNASELNATLRSAVGSGVLLGLLLDANGTTIASAYASDDTARAEEDYPSMVAATANAWRLFAGTDLSINRITHETEPESLEQVLIDLGERKLCAMSVADSATVCLVSRSPDVQMGLLKLKTAALQQRLDLLLRPTLMQ